jgi:hypothetical protein
VAELDNRAGDEELGLDGLEDEEEEEIGELTKELGKEN